MSNIRVDLNTHIQDGTEVVFRSPVDCSQVTGLKVYYPEIDGTTTAKEFAFADAHGNNVGDIDHLFAENVAVKVILDVTTSMAFVQNADTNAYLEGRFKELENKIAQGSGGDLGDIDAALDAIIAIQNELMGVEETVSFTISGQSSTDHYTVPRGMTWGEIAEARLLSYQCDDCQTKNGTLTIVFIERDVVYYQACSECDGSAYELYTDEGMSTCVYADEYPLDGHVYCS